MWWYGCTWPSGLIVERSLHQAARERWYFHQENIFVTSFDPPLLQKLAVHKAGSCARSWIRHVATWGICGSKLSSRSLQIGLENKVAFQHDPIFLFQCSRRWQSFTLLNGLIYQTLSTPSKSWSFGPLIFSTSFAWIRLPKRFPVSSWGPSTHVGHDAVSAYAAETHHGIDRKKTISYWLV